MRLGGADRLLAWVRESPENERVFRSNISPRLLPLQVTGKDEEPFKVASRVLILPAKEPDDTVVRPLRQARAGGEAMTRLRILRLMRLGLTEAQARTLATLIWGAGA